MKTWFYISNLSTNLILVLSLFLSSCQGQTPHSKTHSSELKNATRPPLTTNIVPAKVDTSYHFTSRIGILFEDSKGQIWVASKDEGICKYDGKQFNYYGAAEGLNSVRAIYESPNGHLYFGLEDRVGVLQNSTLTTIFPQEESQLITESLTNSKSKFEIAWKQEQEQFWFSAFNRNGVYRFDGERLSLFTLPVPGDYPEFDDHGYNPEHGYDIYAVYGIHHGRDGNIYFGTAGAGLFRYTGKSIDLINQSEEKGVIRAIHLDKTGMLWFGNNALGVFQYDGQFIENFSKQRGLYKKGLAGALVIAEDRDSRLWFATYDAGLWRYDPRGDRQGAFSFISKPEDVRLYSIKDGLSTNTITAFLEDSHGRLWIGTEVGDIFLFNGDSFVLLN